MHHPTDRITHTRRGVLGGTRNRSMDPPHEGSIRRPTVEGNALFNDALNTF